MRVGVINALLEVLHDFDKIIFVSWVRNYALDLGCTQLECQDEELENEEQLFFDPLLVFIELNQLLHDVFQVLFVVYKVVGKMEIWSPFSVNVLEDQVFEGLVVNGALRSLLDMH